MIKYLSLILVLATLGWAQGEWVVQDNPFNGNDSTVFSDVHALDSLHCWLVGFHRGEAWVLRTSNGGNQWETIGPLIINIHSSPIRLNEITGLGIKFVDSLRGFITFGGGISSTTDGGNSWTFERITYDAAFGDVEFIDSIQGWVVSWVGVGKKGLIYHTDNGKDWVIQDSVNPALHGICFLDSLKGFVVGDSGTLLKTTDGGAQWIKVETGTTKDLMDVQFADSLHGLAVGSDVVLRTVDGGVTWSAITQNIPALLTDVAFPDVVHAWTTTSGIYFSGDTGNTWVGQTIPDIPGNGALWGVSFPDTAHGWACGGYGKIIYYSLGSGVDEANEITLTEYQLHVYPNPSRKTIKIAYNLPIPGDVSFTVYDASGILVRRLTSNVDSSILLWDTKDEYGKAVPQGVYFLKVEVLNKTLAFKKLIVLD